MTLNSIHVAGVGTDTRPVQGAVGTTEKIPSYSLGYGHPLAVVIPPSVSCVLNQPLAGAVTKLGAAENVAGGKMMIGAVLV